MKATLDGREREQSKLMDGFISTANGMYMYPDGKYYRLGTAPAQWCINDRETQYVVFLEENELKNEIRNLHNNNPDTNKYPIVLQHGNNPGLVSHFVKSAIEYIITTQFKKDRNLKKLINKGV